MTKLYTNDDLWDAVRQKHRLFYGFLAAVLLYAAGLIAGVAVYVSLPYDEPNSVYVVVAVSILTGLFILFSVPYMGISYRRSKSYVKMLRFISVGLKEYSVLPFREIDDWTTRDGVDVNVALFGVKNVKKDEELLRRIFVDGEKDFPPFRAGDRVRMVTQGNLLIAYEVIKTDGEAQQ